MRGTRRPGTVIDLRLGSQIRPVFKVDEQLTDDDVAWLDHHLNLAGGPYARIIRSFAELIPPPSSGRRPPPDTSWIKMEQIR